MHYSVSVVPNIFLWISRCAMLASWPSFTFSILRLVNNMDVESMEQNTLIQVVLLHLYLIMIIHILYEYEYINMNLQQKFYVSSERIPAMAISFGFYKS